MTIASMTQQGCGILTMRRALGRAASTIGRELSRNPGLVAYGHLARLQCVARRQAARAETKLDVWGCAGRLLGVSHVLLYRHSAQALGGPNFHEIPTNRAICRVHNLRRDGFYRQTIAEGRVNYEPSSINGPSASVTSLKGSGDAVHFLREAFKHAKAVAAPDDAFFAAIGILAPGAARPAGVSTGGDPVQLAARFLDDVSVHRHWARLGKDAVAA